MTITSTVLAFARMPGVSEQILATTAALKSVPNTLSFRPKEPTTLTLALIGIAIFAVYLATKRMSRPQRKVGSRYFHSRTEHNRNESPTRDAA